MHGVGADAIAHGAAEFLVTHGLFCGLDVLGQGDIRLGIKLALRAQKRGQRGERQLQRILMHGGFRRRPIQLRQGDVEGRAELGTHSGSQVLMGSNCAPIRRSQVCTAEAVNGPALSRTW